MMTSMRTELRMERLTEVLRETRHTRESTDDGEQGNTLDLILSRLRLLADIDRIARLVPPWTTQTSQTVPDTMARLPVRLVLFFFVNLARRESLY